MSEKEQNEKNFIKVSEIENPALVYAMYEMKEKKTREAEGKFISELRRAKFISPAIVEVMGPDGEYKVADNSSKRGDTRIQFMMLTTESGARFLPAFTSMDEVRKWRKEEKLQTVVCNFDQYIRIVTSDAEGPSGIAIDPFGSNILLSRELLEGLRKAIEEQQKTQVYVADVKEHPEELEKALTEFFDENGQVEKAYMQLMKRGETVSFLLIVDHDIPDGASDEEIKNIRKELFDKIANISKPNLKGMALSIAAFADDFGRKAVDNKFPFYTR